MLKRCLNVIVSKLNVAYLLQMKREQFPNLVAEDILSDIINNICKENNEKSL